MLTIVDDKKMGYALGASEYLTKPIDRERLVAVLTKYRRDLPVLVVDDDASVRQLLRRILEEEGYTVVEADNGRVALERLGERVPGAILLDLMMPEMDGFEFLSALHGREAWRQIPVVIVTAKDLTSEEHDRLNGSVVRILQKGAYAQEELLAEVRTLVAASIGRRKGKTRMTKILLVEDNEMNRDMLSRRLQKLGYEVVIAVDGEEGVAKAQAEAPALILMDMSLPGIDGWEATRRLKAADADAEDPGHRVDRSRHDGRSRQGAGGRLRRLRHQAGRAGPAPFQDQSIARNGCPVVSMDREALAHLRHELRTPLNHIIGYSEMLLEDVADGDPAALGPGLRKVHEDAQRLLGVINELAHADAGHVDFERLAAELAEPLRSVLATAEALKLQAVRAGADRAVEDLERVALAATALQSVIADGVSADCANCSPARAGGFDAPADPAERKRAGHILVVDDNAANREMLGRRLEREGHRVQLAAGGREALDLLHQRRADLVLLDVMMPEVDGYQVLQQLKADELAGHPRADDLGSRRDRERRALHRAGGGGLPSQALRPRTAAGPHRRLPGEEAAARP